MFGLDDFEQAAALGADQFFLYRAQVQFVCLFFVENLDDLPVREACGELGKFHDFAFSRGCPLQLQCFADGEPALRAVRTGDCNMLNERVLADEWVEPRDLGRDQNEANLVTPKLGVLRPLVERNDQVAQLGIIAEARGYNMIEIMDDDREGFLVNQSEARKIIENRKRGTRFFRRVLRIARFVIGVIAPQRAKIALALLRIGKLNTTLRIILGDGVITRQHFAAQCFAQRAEFGRGMVHIAYVAG